MTTNELDAGGEGTDDTRTADDGDRDPVDLAARVEVLEAETERLRQRLAETRQTSHRRGALGLAGLGIVAGLAAVVVPGARTVLLALAGTGLFLGVLTYYLTPEQFIAAETGEATYATLAENGRALTAELGLQDRHVYVPVGSGVRLYVPQHATGDAPDETALADTVVVGDDPDERGLAMAPTGSRLFEAFERDLSGETPTDPAEMADSLAQAIAEGFELASSATADVDDDDEGATLRVTDSAYGDVDRFDHPIASLFAVGIARVLDRPVALVVEEPDSGTGDYLVRCSVLED